MTMVDLATAELEQLKKRPKGKLRELSLSELIDLRCARFIETVNMKGKCWAWKGCRFNSTPRHLPYGKCTLFGRRTVAHRMAWLVFKGDIPDGMDVLHTCDNPICCNPFHLFLGDDSTNQQDSLAKGRSNCGRLKGEAHGAAKLTAHAVTQIRNLRNSGASLVSLAEQFGTTMQNIHLIVARKNWRHV